MNRICLTQRQKVSNLQLIDNHNAFIVKVGPLVPTETLTLPHFKNALGDPRIEKKVLVRRGCQEPGFRGKNKC